LHGTASAVFKQVEQFFCYICLVKSMRTISPFISVLLLVLVLSGNAGFTLKMHTCHHCGMQTLVTSLTAAGGEDKCCCGHDTDIESHSHVMGEYVFSHDCCSVETEKMIAVQVFRTEVQPEIIPCYLAAACLTTIPDHDLRAMRLIPDNLQMHDGRALMTMHCQILS
jgi:hypothetical protein